MGLKDIDDYVGNQRLIQVVKEDRRKEENRIIDYVKSELPLVAILETAFKNRMVPFVFSSKESYIDLEGFISNFADRFSNIFVFDLREATLHPNPSRRDLKGNYPKMDGFYEKVKENLARIIAEGGLFIINMDDSLAQNLDFPDPDPKEYFTPRVLPSQIFYLKEFVIPEVFNKVTIGTKWENTKQVNEGMRVVVWSKYKIEECLTKEELNRIIEKKFGHKLPLKEMNFLVYNPPKKSKTEDVPKEEQAPAK